MNRTLLYIAIMVAGVALVLLLYFGRKSGMPDSSDRSDSSGTSGTSSPLPHSTKEQFLKLHNDYRYKAKAPPLKWSKKLAQNAQAWADHQKNNEGCLMRHPESAVEEQKFLNDQGQNIAHFVGTPGSPAACVQGWGPRECDMYNSPGASGTGHFTQMVWKDTKEVGCGKATCGNATIWVCNYSPPGNVRLTGVSDMFALYKKNVTKPC